MKDHIETIAAFLARQMDGDQVPPSNSAALNGLSEAIGAIQRGATDQDLQVLGLRALGAVIERVRSAITTESTLHHFIRGGGHD